MAGVRSHVRGYVLVNAVEKSMVTEKVSRTFLHRCEQISAAPIAYRSSTVNYLWGS